jgi:2-polyprenyl-3-methyl-5-hydroxy-6-metoxy-1,4-benzoquinol methylase
MMRAAGHQAEVLNAVTDDFGGPYDLVFANAMLLHLDRTELATVVRKAYQAVRPGGLWIVRLHRQTW